MGKLHFGFYDRMMREKKREPLTYKNFFIQKWPMDHIVCEGQLFTLKMNFLAQMYLNNNSAQKVV